MVNKIQCTFSILIIDDSPLINNSLTASLRNRGFSVTQAFDVKSAREILQESSFDYALLDLELPDGSGEDVLPYLQIHEEIRVIVMTSDRDKQRRERLFNYGIVIDYITKERYFADMELAIVQLIERVSTNHSYKMIIVDDSRFMRNHLRILLSKRGFQVYDAVDGKEALKTIKAHKIDGAIIDLEMPVMDGNKLLGAIKRDKANLLMPVMVVSGSVDPDKIAKVIKNGASDFIKKPYSNEELLLKVDKMMEDIKQQHLIKVHEARFALYNRAIDEAAIFFKLDSNFNIIYSNSMLNNLLDSSVTIGDETNLESYILPASKSSLESLKESINNFEIFQETFSFKSKQEQILNLRLTFTPILTQANTIDEIIAIGFDVSLLQQKEEDLKEMVESKSKKNWEQNKLLIQQSKMASMGEMIGHIGHQWRQPLNSLAIMFQKLTIAYHRDKLTNILMDSSTEKALRIINQMSKTIDDFSNFFKPDKEYLTCRVSDVITQATNVIESTLETKDIKLITHYENDTSFDCLKNELSQVILNIIANAMDALVINRTLDAEISIAIEERDSNVLIIIDDNAGGVPQNIIEKIFEPYFTTKEKSNGTGIGLYMSKTIVEEHMNGILHVENTLSGASFKITVPIKKKS